jgi:hypothetical protein
MGKLVDVAQEEYDILRQFTEAIDQVVSDVPDKDFLPRFADKVKDDLNIMLALHYDKNNLKRKYYSVREKLKEI